MVCLFAGSRGGRFACVLVVGLGGGVHVLWTITVVVWGRANKLVCFGKGVHILCTILTVAMIATCLFGLLTRVWRTLTKKMHKNMGWG